MLYLPKQMKPIEIARKFGVKPITVWKWLERGLFPNAVKIGRHWDVPETDVQTFVPPKGESDFTQGPPIRGRKPRKDINLECTDREFSESNIRGQLSARERFLALRYFAQLDRERWPDGIKAGQ